MITPLRLALAALVLGALACMLTLFFLDRNISYEGEGVEVECSSIYGFGAADPHLEWGSSGTSHYAVVDGEDAIDQRQREAADDGQPPYFVVDGIERDCDRGRVRDSALIGLLALPAAACLGALITRSPASRRRPA